MADLKLGGGPAGEQLSAGEGRLRGGEWLHPAVGDLFFFFFLLF